MELLHIIQEETGPAADLVFNAITDFIGDMESKIALVETQADNTWADFIPNLLYLTRSKQTYQNLNGDLQKIAEQMIVSLDYSNILADMDGNDPYAYILDHIITPLQNISEKDKVKLSSLLSEEEIMRDKIKRIQRKLTPG